ncbi:MAG: hypothetical protein EOP83_25115 [Verrucomicrobiaceae bacterium]|nr:MAG: hypothetical protein EOP83_25115 [Verrucomicrobiaceae bacterium]
MISVHRAVSKVLLLSFLHFGVCSAVAQTAPEPPTPIPYKDLGPKYEIHGDFGKLYTDFTIKGIVKKPIRKGDTHGTVRIDITHVSGALLPERKVNVALQTDSKWSEGSEVELVVREEAKLSFPEGIDDIASAPDRSHLGRLVCVVSLHERRLISPAPPAK